MGLPRRLLTIIEGEGLINDATALTTYRVAIAAVGGGFSLLSAGGNFVLSAGGGVAIGFAVAWVISRIRRRLDEPLVENALSLATPFLAFIPAEELHVSGVLAVVICGLALGYQAPVLLSSAARLQTRAVWRLIDFLLEGAVFLLIGNQLPEVLDGLQLYATATIVASAVAVVAATILVRPAYIFLVAAVSSLIARGRHTRDPAPPWQHQAILSWAGTRGVISLAAAFALPLTVGDAPFPARDLLVFLTFVVVIVTLVGQGLTIAPLLRWLRVRPEGSPILAQANARHAAVEAGLRRLDELVATEPPPDRVAERLIAVARERQNAGWEQLGRPGGTPSAALASLRRQMIAAEWEELICWRDAGRLDDGSLRVLERELDVEEGLLAALTPGAH